MSSWEQTARRVRVPLGFFFAALYLWLAHPTWESIAAGAILATPGLALRALASGYLRKDVELATRGPYSYTRNPLYLGSVIIAAGFALAARSLWVAAGILVVFLGVYLPVIRAEEDSLRQRFPGYEDYVRRVPRFLPRFTWEEKASAGSESGFSPQLYRQHGEYNAIAGTIAMIVALALKLIFLSRG